MDHLTKICDSSAPDEVLIGWALQIAQLEHENTSFLVRLKEGGFDEEGFIHVCLEDWEILNSYGWLDKLSNREALLGKSKVKPEIVWLLEQVVEVRVILHSPVPEKHELFGKYLQALKSYEAHNRDALSERML